MKEAFGGFVKLLTGVAPHWLGCMPDVKQRIYYANHTSHFDFLLLWAALPKDVRTDTVPAAASCYWSKTPFRKWFSEEVFDAVLIDRENISRAHNPIPKLVSVLDNKKSLIIFPEGGRGATSEIRDFKGGIYHLAKARPDVEFVPCYIDNANRVLPKGEFLPLPILCTVTFGAPLVLRQQERREEFLRRARQSLAECAHEHS